jgi:hypothetical protein
VSKEQDNRSDKKGGTRELPSQQFAARLSTPRTLLKVVDFDQADTGTTILAAKDDREGPRGQSDDDS